VGRKTGFQPGNVPVPSEAAKSLHHVIVGSATQMRRVAAGGSLEADVSLLNARVTEEGKRMRAARNAIEDRKMLKALQGDE